MRSTSKVAGAVIGALLWASLVSAQQVSPTVSSGLGPAAATTQTAASATLNKPSGTTDGLNIQGMNWCLVQVSAASGQTLSGAGTIRLWYYESSTVARWAENMDIYSTQAVSANRDAVTQAFPVGVKAGRLYPEARSVTSSSGALTVRLICWK